MKRNKFGVPYRRFVLRLADGRAVAMDSGCEEDWGNVQQCLPDDWPDWKTAVGRGNDAGGFSCRLSGGYDAAGRIFLMLQEKSGGTFGGLDHSDDWA